jgi:enoyl-CoA hydratase/carnithine racemase
LNAFNDALYTDVLSALREFDGHPETVFTVLTGTGRFFSSGADVKGSSASNPSAKDRSANPAPAGIQLPPAESTAVDKKLFYLTKFARGALRT